MFGNLLADAGIFRRYIINHFINGGAFIWFNGQNINIMLEK